MSAKKILVIDDDRQVSLALTIRLQAAGYEMHAAYDGESGLEKAAEVMPDVILLDIRLPGIDGIEVMHRIKRHEKISHCPVIFVSANAQEITKRTALGAGGRFFLEKPFNSKDLLHLIEQVFTPVEAASTTT